MHSAPSRLAVRTAAYAAALVCGMVYAQSVNLRPGLYEWVSTSQVTLSPQLQARLPPGYLQKLQKPRTQQQCLGDADLKQLGRKLSEERGNDPSCKMTDQTVSGNQVKFVLHCQRATTHFEGTFSGTSFKALLSSQTDRGPMKISLTGRRIGDCAR